MANSVFHKIFRIELITALAVVTFGTQAYGKTETPLTRETRDRRVDRVALQAKSKAIAQLENLLNKYRGTPRESLMLIKLAEYQQQSTSIEFRIAHGDANRLQTEPDLTRYNKSLQDVITTTDTIINKFQTLGELDRVYFMRGSSYDELQKRDLAKKDFLTILTQFKHSAFGPQSNMVLAGYEVDANNYAAAIPYLKEVEKLPDDSHFPFALYQLAWAYYNLKNFPQGISYLERHIAYYHARETEDNGADFSQSDQAILEHSLLDVVNFYMEGFEAKIPAYSVKNALVYFKKLEKRPFVGQMFLRYAKLLRSHGHDADLLDWKDQLLAVEYSRAESLGVLLVAFEYFYNARQFEKVTEIAHDFERLDNVTKQKMRKYESYVSAQKQLLDTADRLQKLTVKNKNANEKEVEKLVRVLDSVYQAFINIVDEKDPRIPVAHYNLAEVLFVIKNYEQSSQNYLWIVKNWNRRMTFEKKEIYLKLLGSRYQALDQKALIPKKLTPGIVKDEAKIDETQLNPQLAQWIHWIDDYSSAVGKRTAEIENFEFEADRALYAQNQIRPATDRLMVLLDSDPDTKFFVPSASLVLDTYILSQRWENVHQFADHFALIYKKAKVRDPEFEKKVVQIGGDAFYKVIETAYKAKDYDKALKLVDQFKNSYSGYSRYSDTLFLASRVALETKAYTQAFGYLDELLTKFPKSESHVPALLIRGSLEDERYEFDAAIRDYSTYLAEIGNSKTSTQPTNEEVLNIKKKMFQMRWLSPTAALLDCKPFEKNDNLFNECDRYQALNFLKWPTLEIPSNIAVMKKAIHGEKNNRALWAGLALKKEQGLSFHDRLLLSRVLATSWGHLDSLAQFATIPLLSDTMSSAIQLTRKSLKAASPLKANGKSIERRIEFMSEIETTATQLVKLPWAHIKAEVLLEISKMYLEFSDELAHLKTPAGISGSEREEYAKSLETIITPFLQKGKKLQEQALEVASDFTIQKELVLQIQPELEIKEVKKEKSKGGDDKRKSERKVAAKSVPTTIRPLDLEFFTDFEQSVSWNKLKIDRNSPTVDRIESLWLKAMERHDLPQIAFFIQEFKEKGHPKPSALKFMRSTALFAAGAQAEALDELESVKLDLEEKERRNLNEVLYPYYFGSHSDKKTKKILSELEAPKK